MTANDLTRISRVLISVSNKSNLTHFAQGLADHGVELLSTGGTAKAIAEAGIPVKEVSDHTGFPEMMDGRVKTLHPKIHGGLLGLRDKAEHQDAMTEHDIGGIDLLVVNLYPFEETVARGAEFDECIENIDIGGPAMIRSAAKNHRFVTVVVDPDDYDVVLAEMQQHDGATSSELKRKLAAKAYQRTGSYDAAIANWFAEVEGDNFPDRLLVTAERGEILRYGENPHQQAAFYRSKSARPGLATAKQIQGKALSYNNYNDTDAALDLISEFNPTESAAVAIIKHANPCGVAMADTLLQAYLAALKCDPVSAFGGIVACNQDLDSATAKKIAEIFTEVIVAPNADHAAKEDLAANKNLRLLLIGELPNPKQASMAIRNIGGGYLLQNKDIGRITRNELTVVSKRQPSEREMSDMLMAFRICKHVKSNAIIYVKNGATVGMGAGQMSRVDSSRIAARKAQDAADAAGERDPLTIGSVVASDAFFPFADGLLAAAEAGATAIIQPGGSIRDDEVIAAADDAGLAMVLTGMRHFHH